jgi:phosphate transport system protein
MSQRFLAELEDLRDRIAQRGDAVQAVLADACQALLRRDDTKAREVLATREQETTQHAAANEECQRLLALYQPVATDLRLIVAILKINDELERMHRLAEGIARHSLAMSGAVALGEFQDDFERMAGATLDMVRRALGSVASADIAAAQHVLDSDDAVDSQKKALNRRLRDHLVATPGDAPSILHLLDVPRRLERVADLATNISEEVIHLATNTIPRHGLHLDDPPGGS